MKDIFCSKCQAITPHKGSVDANGEFIFECQNQVAQEDGSMLACDRFVKFPADVDPSAFESLVAKHAEVNVGQVSLEGQEKKLDVLLGVAPADEVIADVPSENAEQPIEPVEPTE